MAWILEGRKAALWIGLHNLRNHWLLVVLLPEGHALVFDSLSASLAGSIKRLSVEFINDMLPASHKNWQFAQAPQQTDGFSCGLFALYWAGCVASASPICVGTLPSFESWKLPHNFRTKLHAYLDCRAVGLDGTRRTAAGQG